MKQLLKFSADAWCAPCKMIKPIVEDVTNELGIDLVSYDVDDDEAGPIAKQYNVRGVPTLVYLEDGVVKWQHVGALSKTQLLDKLSR